VSGPVFVDCETTGLDPDRHEIWELAIISNDDEWVWQLPVDLSRADPTGLRIGRFYERRAQVDSMGAVAALHRVAYPRADGWSKLSVVRDTAQSVAFLLDGHHMVGAVPSFDAAFLSRWLRAHGQAPTWSYHLIDVEALAAGYIVGQFTAIQEVGKNPESDGPTQEEAMSAIPPWDSEELSRAVGVDPDDIDRHTALGDARWAKHLYEAVLGG
jgi:hypothetical protein